MIKRSATGLVACYNREGWGSYVHIPVVGWREGDGAALIAEHRTGRLVPATEYVTPNGGKFVHVMPAERPIVAAVPGQGWRVKFEDYDDKIREEPVIAFAINAEGQAIPVAHTGVGIGETLDLHRRNGHLISPDGTEGHPCGPALLNIPPKPKKSQSGP